MKMNVMKKIGALLLIAVITASMLAVPTFAAESAFFSVQGSSVEYVDELGLYVATGNTGVYTSADGLKWTKRYAPTGGGAMTYFAGAYAYNEEQDSALYALPKNYYRAVWMDKYMTTAKSMHMIVKYKDGEKHAYNTAADENKTKFTYLHITGDLTYDPYTKKYYCGAVETTDGTTYVDVGLYCSDGVRLWGKTSSTFHYGAGEGKQYGDYMVWEKVELGTSDPYLGATTYTAEAAPYAKIDADGEGRMVASIFSNTQNSFGISDGVERRRMVLMIDNRKTVADYTTPLYKIWYSKNGAEIVAALDNGYIVAGGNNCIKYQSFATLAKADTNKSVTSTGLAYLENTALNVTSGESSYSSASANTGKTSSGNRHFAFVDGMTFAFPTVGLNPVADADNNIKAVAYTKKNYNSIIMSDATMKSFIGNTTAEDAAVKVKNIVDVAAGPDGKIVILTDAAQDGVFVLDTAKWKDEEGNWTIDPTSKTDNTDRSSALLQYATAETEVGGIKVSAEDTTLMTGESTNIVCTLNGGSASTEVEGEVTLEVVGEIPDALTLDTTAKTIAAKADAEFGAYTITVKVSSVAQPSVYAVQSLSFEVGELKLEAAGSTQYIAAATQVAATGIAAGENTIKVTGIKAVDKAYNEAAMIVSLYNKDGVLISAGFDQQELAQGASFAAKEFTLNVPEGTDLTDAYLKVYTWNALSTMRPL